LNGRKSEIGDEKKIEEYGLTSLLGYIPEVVRPIIAMILNKAGMRREAYAMTLINKT
jgi:hypothetical protein